MFLFFADVWKPDLGSGDLEIEEPDEENEDDLLACLFLGKAEVLIFAKGRPEPAKFTSPTGGPDLD